MALSSDQINQIINGQNQSSGGWGAAPMPTMAMPQGAGSNAIPTGAIAGRNAQGLLDSRNAPNYIGGLLGKYNPGQGSSAATLAGVQSAVAPPGAAAAAAAAPAAEAAPEAPNLLGPDGQPWNFTNGGVVMGYNSLYNPIFGGPGSRPYNRATDPAIWDGMKR